MQIVEKLFPDIRKEVTLVGGGSRRSVTELREILNELAARGEDEQRVWAITDEDADEGEASDVGKPKQVLKWDRYHIENFLLEEKYIAGALHTLELEGEVDKNGEANIRIELKDVCRKIAREFAIEKVTRRISRSIRRFGYIDARQLQGDVGEGIARRAEEIVADIQQIIGAEATKEQIQEDIRREEGRLLKSVGSANWKRLFRGRDVLRRFCAGRTGNLRYETLRNVIVSEMARDGFQPAGMKKRLDAILRG